MSDFFSPEIVEKTFERNGTSKTFQIRELTGEETENLFDLEGKDGKKDKAKAKGLDARIVALAITVKTDAGPEAISLDRANKLPAKLRRELVQAFLDLNVMTAKAQEAVEQD